MISKLSEKNELRILIARPFEIENGAQNAQ